MLGVKFSQSNLLVDSRRRAASRCDEALPVGLGRCPEPEARIVWQLSSRPAALKRGKGELIDVLEQYLDNSISTTEK